MTDRELINLAKKASSNAYVPYSRFRVGAALECEDGSVYTGCNVENAALGDTICAERCAALKAISEGNVAFRRIAVWDAINVGNLVNVVLPGAGEFVRCGYVSSKRMSYDKAFGTIACERVFDVLMIFILISVALVLKWDSFGTFFVENVWQPMAGRMGGALGWVLGGVVLLLAALVWAVFRFRSRVPLFERIAGAFRGLATGFASIAKMERKWPFLLSTLGIWAMYVLTMWCTVRALPALDGMAGVDILFLSAVSNIASVIPVPGGIGAYHYLVALSIQSLYGASWETGILAATLGHEAHALLIIIVGVISYVRFSLRKKK